MTGNLINLPLPRRTFLKGVLAGAGALASGTHLVSAESLAAAPEKSKPAYRGPNVIIVRFGGGVRRHETIDPDHTYAPFFLHTLVPQGAFFPRMEINQLKDINTSHGEGTLYIMTGKYEKFKGVSEKYRGLPKSQRPPGLESYKFLDARFEASVPTVFEYLRSSFDIAAHQTLIVNSEDRGDEEFYNFSNHHLFGVRYQSNTLSLRRYKIWLLRRQIAEGRFPDHKLAEKKKKLQEMESVDYRQTERQGQVKELQAFWERWRVHYGESGLVNPRGDRLLTELTLRALDELRPRLMMVNYTDPDYVHWGNINHYTRGIAIIDEGLKQLDAWVRADPEYRDNTIFVIVPDCGRDSNPLAPVPCQHHFNSRSAHEIFALIYGAGIARGVVVDKRADQSSIASTIGKAMGFKAEFAEGPVLGEAFA